MLQVNQTAQVTITGYTSQGEGVCRVDGCAVFVPNALRGETCQITVTHVGRTQAHGRIDRLAEPSPHRVDRLCPWAKQCGGCQLWHMDYTEELTFKEYGILELLMRNKGITLSIKQIYESVWNEEFYASENTVMMHIANLRRKLNSDGRDYIKTVWGRGYRI